MGLPVRDHSTSIRAASVCSYFSVTHMQIVVDCVGHKVSQIRTIITYALKGRSSEDHKRCFQSKVLGHLIAGHRAARAAHLYPIQPS